MFVSCAGGMLSNAISAMPEIAFISEINPINNRSGSTFETANPLILLESKYHKLSIEQRITSLKLLISEVFEFYKKADVGLNFATTAMLNFTLAANLQKNAR